MSFTPLTLLIFIIFIPTVTVSSFRGFRKGFYPTALKGASVLLALLIASLISSNFISVGIAEEVWGKVGFELGEVGADVPAVEVVIKALLSAIISPFVFLPIFLAVYIVLRIVMAILMAVGKNKDADAKSCNEENASWFRKKSAPIGAFVGGLSGFVFAVVIVSPFVGTLMNTGHIISVVENMQSLGTPAESEPDMADGFDDGFEEEEEAESEDDEVLSLIKDLSSDFGATIVYHMGGSLIYNISARAEIDGVGFALSKEVSTLSELFSKEGNMFTALFDMTSIEDNEIQSLKNTCNKVKQSYLLSYTMAGFLSSVCSGWIDGETVMGMAPPDLAPEVAPLMNSMLKVFSTSYADTVATDMTTLVNVLEILNSSEIFTVGGDYAKLISVLADGSFIDTLVAELGKNSRMEPVMNNIHVIATQALVNQMKMPGYDEEEYHGFANDIAKELNGMTTFSESEKVGALTQKAMELVGNQDIEVPESMARLIIENMLKDVKPKNDTYNASQIMEYLDKFQTENNP